MSSTSNAYNGPHDNNKNNSSNNAAISVSVISQGKGHGKNDNKQTHGSQNNRRQRSKNNTAIPDPGVQNDTTSTDAPETNNQQQQMQRRRSRNNNINAGRGNDNDGKNSTKAPNGNRSRKSGKMRAAVTVGGGRMFDGSLTHDYDVSEENDDDSGGTSIAGYVRHDSEAISTSAPLGLSSSLSKRLANSTYECMICCDKVRPRHAIWQCDTCWAIFHIGCVKKWAKSCSDGPNVRWRCPGCQHPRAAAPSHYFCFCGATRDPEFTRGSAPHSCGRICGRNRGRYCPHVCPLPCHPGPCPPCTAMAPEQFCFCGRSSYQPRCGSGYDPVEGIKSCEAVCGEMLGCGKHTCTQACHPGLCQPCGHQEDQLCYCGKHTRTASCGSGMPLETYTSEKTVDGSGVEQCVTACAIGFYHCDETCTEMLDCGIHQCDQKCHPHRDPALGHGECPLDPKTVTTCYCGKSTAVDLGLPRIKCTDPVPSCAHRCQKQLSGCTHLCNEVCHPGPCPPCKEQVKTRCRCGSKSFNVECHKAQSSSDERPTCQRLCSKKRACRRHQCSLRCCPSSHEDIDGTVLPSENIAPGVTDPHQCTLVCNRLLRCKMHNCTELCHRGPCPPCRNTSFDELSCACGRTRILPPIPCGTTLPPCRYPCQRTRSCGHINLTSHECHPDEDPCPPCPVLVTVRCMCGGKEMKSVPCHRSSAASCGGICNKLLPCGGHRCKRSCHRPDEPCLRDHVCRQTCGKPRKTCGHPCALTCHSPAMCDESVPCKTTVTITCGCGRLTTEDTCGSTANSSRNGSSNTKRLQCNEVCMIALRNRRLALAFGIKNEVDTPLSGLVRATYTEDMLQFTRANLGWVREIESMVASFIGDSRKQTLRFKPMKQALRGFLHALGPYYGCNSRSMDREPLRSVSWERTAHATIPSITLSSAIRYIQPPQIICSERVNKEEDSDLDDSASHIFDGYGPGTNVAAERLRKKIDYIAISDLRHGLTCEELTEEIRRVIPHAMPFTLRWKEEDLVEMYCQEVESRNEHLIKWESILKSKLPHLGVAGSVVGKKCIATPAVTPAPGPSSVSQAQSPRQRPRTGSTASSTSVTLPEDIAPIIMPSVEHDSVPDDWESINIQDDDDEDGDDEDEHEANNKTATANV
ncbi:FKBP12-associated protein [Coemansia sp. RSA 1646]|nr:FKBP12-associated protein [Coemansia sp. RSA 1646]